MQKTLSEIGYSNDEQLLAGIAKALGRTVRLRILALLAKETCCFTGELTEVIPAYSPVDDFAASEGPVEAGLIQGEINHRRCGTASTGRTGSEPGK